MTTYVNGPHNDELEIRNSDLACAEGLPRAPGKRVPVRSEPLTHERVVAEIVQAITICTSFPGSELNGETNLALDLGLESISRVELLAEVECTLGVALDVEVAVFAELTIAELADLVVTALQEDSTD
jgi:acyl carrier protein